MDEIKMIIKTIGANSNLKNRPKPIKESIFNGDALALSELSAQIDMADVTSFLCVELLLTCQFADEAGSIFWTDVIEKMTQKLEG